MKKLIAGVVVIAAFASAAPAEAHYTINRTYGKGRPHHVLHVHLVDQSEDGD